MTIQLVLPSFKLQKLFKHFKKNKCCHQIFLQGNMNKFLGQKKTINDQYDCI